MANPTSVLSWTAFSGADSYEVRIKTSGGSVVSGPTQVFGVSTLLGPLMTSLAAGSYQVELRASVGGYFTAWSAPVSFTWSLEVPGTVSGISIT
jgi:hypothetical protein